MKKMFKSIASKLRFNGSDYDPKLDNSRLATQLDRVFDSMKDANWRTLGQIEKITKDPQSSISAQLRHLRKARFGSHTVNKRRIANSGLFEYQLLINN